MRSDAVLDARHIGNPFEQRHSAFSRFKQVFALVTNFATLRGDSSASLGMTNKAAESE